jgi:Gas vesicle synthesis protein GvpL/GvpF
VLYLYAIADTPHCPPVRGLQGAPLSVDGGNGLFAIWSEHDHPRLEADETALWEHERVVEALAEHATVLPMRFGSWLADREGLLELLGERRDEFTLGLDRVRGAVEIGVRAMLSTEHAEVTSAAAIGERPGTAYMLARLNEESHSAALAARIHEPLRPLSRASRPRRTSLAGAVNTAYLVDRADIGSFRAKVEELDEALGEGTVLCTGPWPPYSFTPEESRR